MFAGAPNLAPVAPVSYWPGPPVITITAGAGLTQLMRHHLHYRYYHFSGKRADRHS